MPRYLFVGKGLNWFLKLICSSTFICVYLVCCAYVIYSQYTDERISKNYTKESQYSERKPRCAMNYTETKNETAELIYILIWLRENWRPWQEEGQRSFVDHECPFTNCYTTLNRSLFGDEITKFGAIVFNGHYNKEKLVRSPKQKYIFYSMESASRFPVCEEYYDGFFNWTVTFKLNSDIVDSYFHIKNNNGEVVGPKRNMEWIADTEDIDENLEKILRNKTKIAAWFSSHCEVKSGRDEFVRNLQKHLNKYNLTIDVYGKCGPLKCRRSLSNKCDSLLEKDYYFYMSLENSFDEDYVTEKLLRALQNNVVPIVYGGANYSRFLPPGSYIDGRTYSASDLADIMYGLTLSQTAYSQYFRWKKYYTYHDSWKLHICNLCEALNNKKKVQTFSVNKHFRHWWNKDYELVCKAPRTIE